MEKENTAKSGAGMEGKMRDCCGEKGFSPEMMEKMMGCCGEKERFGDRDDEEDEGLLRR